MEEKKLYKGVITANAKGFGFCKFEDESIEDAFIAPPNMNGAFNNDVVMVELFPSQQRDNLEGKVVEILQRGNRIVVGSYSPYRNFGYVIVDDKKFYKDVFIPPNKSMDANRGDKVVVELVTYGDEKTNPSGKIIEVIGNIDKKGNDILAIIRKYELYEEFPKDVLKSANAIGEDVKEKDKLNRRDLRNEVMFTIDGEDAKDFDDAVSIKKTEKGYYLGVHIADVGNYVKRGSTLDKEAYLRGTSVYLPDRVLPMLPVNLSNGICSLKPKVDRLTLSVLMQLDENANVIDYEICESVINSNERLTYKEVYACLMGDEELCKKYSILLESFHLMAELHEKLEKARQDRGALDFDLPEAYIIIDQRGKTKDIVPRERNVAHKLIESFMILANEVVAKHYNDLHTPFMYRVHEVPEEQKMVDFMQFISAFNIRPAMNPSHVKPKDLQSIIKATKDQEYAKTINEVLLRSLQKARYSTECLGHFGLASTYYCHFTSPIRRYPDLVIHRIIKDSLNNRINQEDLEELKEFVADSALRSSEREKLAERCEREVCSYKKAEYMQNFIGQEFDASITGVSQYGIFVGLENTVEGFVSVDDMPDDEYTFNEKRYCLQGRKRKYMIGEPVRVKLKSVNLPERKVDFVLV